MYILDDLIWDFSSLICTFDSFPLTFFTKETITKKISSDNLVQKQLHQ